MNFTNVISKNSAGDYSPGRLLVLTCDAALRYLHAAEAGLAGGNASAAAVNVRKAQRILLELIGALDPFVAPDAADAVGTLYQHLFDRLSEPDAVTDPSVVRDAHNMLAHIRNAWAITGSRRWDAPEWNTGPLGC